MHELGIVFYIIDDVEEVVEKNELTTVSSVTLELGEVSGVVPSYLDDVWNWAVKKHE
ncbi:MAG: hydrogenase maturation nickel metallochaperone HypA, partial [Clostridia bacterium]|nr:hydrogenase maturation nickel metallochaperone HypA [Clostridia bacterium]